MKANNFFKIVRDLFLPQQRNACPHCGGIRCIGVCQFDKKPLENHQADAATKTDEQTCAGKKEKK